MATETSSLVDYRTGWNHFISTSNNDIDLHWFSKRLGGNKQTQYQHYQAINDNNCDFQTGDRILRLCKYKPSILNLKLGNRNGQSILTW